MLPLKKMREPYLPLLLINKSINKTKKVFNFFGSLDFSVVKTF